jgi:hypothetical protein
VLFFRKLESEEYSYKLIMKRRIFFSRRMPPQVVIEEILDVNINMSEATVTELYTTKRIENEKFIRNGPWTLRPVLDKDGSLADNLIPTSITAKSVWAMVKHKIDDSDVLIAIVNSKAYGTVVEIGYAVGLSKMAVYVLADLENTYEDTIDLWMSFYLAHQTKEFWNEEDILNIEEFNIRGIHSIQDYEAYINNIIPRFLAR